MSATVHRPLPRDLVGLTSTLRHFLIRSEAPSLVFLVLLIAVFAATAEGFFTVENLQLILDQVAIIGVIALAVNLVVLSGEIDISVGSTLALVAMTAARVAVDTGSFVLAFGAAVGVGVTIGMVNGLLVTRARVPSIIATLGMLYSVRGFVLADSDAGIGSIPDSARALGQGTVLGVNVTVVVLLVTFGVIALLSRHSTWGRDVIAVGGNPHAAHVAGLPVARTRFLTFVLVGVCTALAAMMYIGQLGLVQPQAATGLELQIIAAVVIGGTSIAGGRGSAAAALVGAILIGVMLNGMNLLGIQERWQDVFTGGLILLAVTADVIRRRILDRLGPA